MNTQQELCNDMELLKLFPEFRVESNEVHLIEFEIENYIDKFQNKLLGRYNVTDSNIEVLLFSDYFNINVLQHVRRELWNLCQDYNIENKYNISIGIVDIISNS